MVENIVRGKDGEPLIPEEDRGYDTIPDADTPLPDANSRRKYQPILPLTLTISDLVGLRDALNMLTASLDKLTDDRSYFAQEHKLVRHLLKRLDNQIDAVDESQLFANEVNKV